MKILKIIVPAIILLLESAAAYSQFYPFDSIPDNLKRRADAVVRSSQCLYTVTDPSHSTMKIRKAVTLLNEDADNFRYLEVMYGKYSKVNYIKGTVYDEKGKVVKSLGMMDVFDMSAISGGAFYSDDRVKILRFPLNKYPFTIEYEYEIEFNSILSYPEWSFQDMPGVSVEESGIQYVFPLNEKVRFLEKSLTCRVDSVVLEKKKVYTWQESNIPAWPENNDLAIRDYNRPVLDAAPTFFEYGGYRGSMKSWETFGEWVYSITAGRDILPPEEIDSVKKIAARYSNKREVVKAIYEYMQSRTRYVSIQLGIGGYRTAEASDVSKNGFGDCKALVNYTMALLKYSGIESFYTLVKAGQYARDINTRFVDSQFNHAILCVPLEKDTIWLECTDQNLPFNYLGTFTDNRHVLLITPEGGKLAKTPAFRSEENLMRRTGTVHINILGTSSANYSESYSGSFYDILGEDLTFMSESEMKKLLYKRLIFPDISITSAKYSANKTEKPSSLFEYAATIKGFGSSKGNRVYFNPVPFPGEYLSNDSAAMIIPYSAAIIDSITYYLPMGYRVESVPVSISLSNEYGNYSCSLKVDGEKVVLYRKFELKSGVIAKDKYSKFRKYYNSIAKNDRRMLIIRRQSS